MTLKSLRDTALRVLLILLLLGSCLKGRTSLTTTPTLTSQVGPILTWSQRGRCALSLVGPWLVRPEFRELVEPYPVPTRWSLQRGQSCGRASVQ